MTKTEYTCIIIFNDYILCNWYKKTEDELFTRTNFLGHSVVRTVYEVVSVLHRHAYSVLHNWRKMFKMINSVCSLSYKLWVLWWLYFWEFCGLFYDRRNKIHRKFIEFPFFLHVSRCRTHTMSEKVIRIWTTDHSYTCIMITDTSLIHVLIACKGRRFFFVEPAGGCRGCFHRKN